MESYPCNGYVVAVEDLKSLIVPNKRKEFEELVSEPWEDEPILEFLQKNLPRGCAKPAEVFMLSDEDFSEDLDSATWYAYFCEEDLFVKKEKAGMKFLRKHKYAPVNCSWTRWG